MRTPDCSFFCVGNHWRLIELVGHYVYKGLGIKKGMHDEGGEEVFTFNPIEENVESAPPIEKVGQEQIHGLLFGDKLSWQAIIYDLMNTERLDPWDIDISLLANRCLGKVKEFEEANFFVSSKVLLAAAL